MSNRRAWVQTPLTVSAAAQPASPRRKRSSLDAVAVPAALLALGALCSCNGLTQDAGASDPSRYWEGIGAGTHTLGASSGWGIFSAEVALEDTSGSPDLGSGTDDTDLEPIAGGAAKYNYFFTDNFALGGIVEFRTFEADPVAPLESTISPDEYTSIHYLLTTRYYTDPLESNPRIKLFGGIDLGYIDGISLDATVQYSPSFQERVTLEGDEYWTLGFVAGASYWLAESLSVEFGAFLELPLDSTDDDLILNIPQGGGGTDANLVSGEVTPEGLIFFLGLTYYI